MKASKTAQPSEGHHASHASVRGVQDVLVLPNADVPLGDGRTLRREIGSFPMREILKQIVNKQTLDNIKDERTYYHRPSRLVVRATLDHAPRFGTLLHISMSYPDHNPTWDEIKAVRYAFYPKTIDVMMMLPKDGDYVNVHPYCFHLWQCPSDWDLL